MRRPLERFTFFVTILTLLLFLMYALPPVNDLWYIRVSSLRPDLAALCKSAFPFVILVPLLCPVQNFYQAILVNRKKTRAVFISLLVFLAVIFIVFCFGLVMKRWMGIYIVVTGMSLATAAQVLFLRHRALQPDC